MWRVGVICCFSIGCGGLDHTTFAAPPSTITAEQRIALFNSLAASTELTTWTVETMTGTVSHVRKSITLVNGTDVEAAEDLLPLVGPESATGRHARAALRNREAGDRWRDVALGVVVGALIASAARGGGNPFEDKWDAAIWAAAGAIGLFTGAAAGDNYGRAAKESNLAFDTYTKDLADRLQICVLNMQLVPCEYRAPEPAAPPEPAPPPVPAGQSVPDGPVAGR